MVQPGPGLEAFRTEMNVEPLASKVQSLRELFSALAEMAQPDGVELVLLVSS